MYLAGARPRGNVTPLRVRQPNRTPLTGCRPTRRGSRHACHVSTHPAAGPPGQARAWPAAAAASQLAAGEPAALAAAAPLPQKRAAARPLPAAAPPAAAQPGRRWAPRRSPTRRWRAPAPEAGIACRARCLSAPPRIACGGARGRESPCRASRPCRPPLLLQPRALLERSRQLCLLVQGLSRCSRRANPDTAPRCPRIRHTPRPAAGTTRASQTFHVLRAAPDL